MSDARTWWIRPGLDVSEGRLRIAGRDAEILARERGTPVYVHDLERVREQVRAMQEAMGHAGLDHRVRLALKAQREPHVLAVIRELGPPGSPVSVGMDVCSPGELLHALGHGWEPDEISYTGTNVSERDLDVILDHPDVHLNVDLITQIHRVGRRARGRAIGLRVNPRGGAHRTGAAETLYSGDRPTKFGIYPEQLDEALGAARQHDLTINTVHFHVGDGYLTDGLPSFELAVERAAGMARLLQAEGCPIREVNVGGGMGVPQEPAEEPLDLGAWAGILARYLGPLEVVVATEPGDFLVKECATLLAEVVTVEEREGVPFVGLDVGWNAMGERFIYRSPLELVLCRAADADRSELVTISGHINEGDDLFAEAYPFPPADEGDIVAALGVGSYNASMACEHCLRPHASTVFLDRV